MSDRETGREVGQFLEDEAGGVHHKAGLLADLQVAAEQVYSEWQHDDTLASSGKQLIAMCWLIQRAEIRLTNDGELIVHSPDSTPKAD